MVLKVTSRVVDLDGPLVDLVPGPRCLLWLDPGTSLVGWGEAVLVQPGAGTDRFARAETLLTEALADAVVDDEVGVPGSGAVAFGSFTFDARTGGSVLVVPRVVVGRADGTTWVTTADPDDAEPIAAPGEGARPPRRTDRVRYAGASQPDVRWLAAVDTAVEDIGRGELEKVVLARDHAVWSHEAFDPRELAARLHARFPACATFHVEALVGASPERLLRRRGRHVASHVLAGTTGRSDDAATDAALGAALLASDKDQREHVLAADSAAAVLGPLVDHLARTGPGLRRLDNVQHLATDLGGVLHEPMSSLALVAALHPTAAVGGTPTDLAVQRIRELEGMDRGRYAGPVGWTDANGDGDWNIALRCAEVSGARARLFAGNGIVAGSLPEDELEETRLKLLAMQRALSPAGGR